VLWSRTGGKKQGGRGGESGRDRGKKAPSTHTTFTQGKILINGDFFDDTKTNEVLSQFKFLNRTYPFSDFKIFFDKILRNFGYTTSQMNVSQI